MSYRISTSVDFDTLSLICAAGRPLTLILSIEDPSVRFNNDERYEVGISLDDNKYSVSGEGFSRNSLDLDLSVLTKLSDTLRLKVYFEGKKIASFGMRTFDREFDKMRSHCGM